MKQHLIQLRRPGFLIAAFVVALTVLTCAFALPGRALADEATVVAHSIDAEGQRTDYTDIQKAVESGYYGAVIVMDTDWDFGSGSLKVSGGKSLIIDMNGHKISTSGVYTIDVLDKASLKLTSSAAACDFSYRGYAKTGGDLTDQTWGLQDLTVNAGGLVTNYKKDYFGFGISVGSDAWLQLENVAVAGCFSEGINVGSYATVDMTNTVVCHNSAGTAPSSAYGGGVHFAFTGATLNMNNSHIDDNYAQNNGGGVFMTADSTLTMENGSTISRNAAGDGGGGIYCGGSRFTIKSQDGTGVIEGNACLNTNGASQNTNLAGGGIHVNAVKGSQSALIQGVTIKGNYSGYDGGGVELDQESTRLVNCKILGNSARCDGGGVFVYDDNNSIEGCEIRDNYCGAKGSNYEGGGVFVSYHYDIKMDGLCVIKGNTRNSKDSGNADDVFLGTVSGGSGKAYITGSLAEGSSVGVRTGITDERRIAKNFKHKSNDCLFYDLSGYYVSYGTDEGGDAWQRHTTKEFTVRLGSEVYGKYRNGDEVTVVTPTFKGSRIFWRWDPDVFSGLYPVSDYVSGDGLRRSVLGFAMPQNDVGVGALYTTRAEGAEVRLDAPVVGRPLPSTAKVRRDDNGIGSDDWTTASVTWYEVDGDKKTQVSGAAQPGTKYQATVRCMPDGSIPLFFDKSINWGTVKVTNDSGWFYPAAASVDSWTDVLTVEASFETAGEKFQAKTETATVKAVNGGLEAGLGGGASETASIAALSDEGDAQSDGRVDLGEFDVSWIEGDEEVTIVAPTKEGYNFCSWEGALEGWERDDVLGTVTLPCSEVAYINQLVAVYTPAVTRVEVEMDEPAPEAGRKLATKVKSLVLTGTDGSALDLVAEIGAGERPVTWLSGSGDRVADYSTAYTALVELVEDDGFEGVEKVLAGGAQVSVTCAGAAVEAEGAGFTVVDGKLCLAMSFPATADAKVTGMSQPADVELSFEEAKACASEGIWPLPGSVDVALESGVAAEGDIEWQAVEGFDEGATGAQELTAHGTVTRIATADDSAVDLEGASLDVSATIKVTAPSQEGDEGNGDAAGTNAGGSKSALAKTGDSIPVFALMALVAIAVVAAAGAGASVASRRRK